MTPETPNQTPNYLELSDEEIMGMSAPAAPAPTAEELAVQQAEVERVAAEQAAEAAAEAERQAAEAQAETERLAAEQAAANPPGRSDDGASAGDGEGAAAAQTPEAKAAAEAAEAEAARAAAADKAQVTPPKQGEAPGKEEAAAPKVPTAEDHKAFYERLLVQPIKANGKEIRLRSPEEAERLIQMGLNYTKKMQAWQPRMRVVTMLENNGLLDEAKLAHLIDLSKGDQLAIQKLLADTKFDPLSADAEKAASYKPGNHQVSDTEVAFNAALDELETSATGAELITEVAKQWDEQSKQAAYQDPSILRTINEHKALGLYAVIHAEMEHLKALGQLQGVPFLQAYRAVGDMLHDQRRLQPAASKQATPAVPVETRVAAPKAPVKNDEKAKAASTTKAMPASAKTEPNYLDLPDDQFLKQMQGRV